MTLDGIFSVLENISKTLENKEGKVQKIKLEFDNELGIDKEEHDKIVSLLDEFEDSEETMKFYEKEMENACGSVKKFNEEIVKLRDELASGVFTPEEKAEKERDLEEKIRIRKNYDKSKEDKEKSQIKLKKRGIDDIGKASKAHKEMEASITSLFKKGGLTKAIGSIKGSVGSAVAQMLVSVIEFGIGKASEYTKVFNENLMRSMTATTTATVNQMKVGVESWKNSVEGAYSAQQMSVDSQLAVMEAANATSLANLKLVHTWTNWIPIWGELNKAQELMLELEQQIKKMELENAQKRISQFSEYVKLTDDYIKKQDSAVHKYQTLNGLTIDQTQIFEKRMLANGEAFAKFNKTIEDALEMQNKFAEQSGRAVNFSDEDYTKSFGVGRLVGEDNLTQFQSMMNIFNSSVSSSADLMYDMYNDANKMGISQQRLTKNVLGNLKMANKYDFKNGTRGFIEMAKWAESARVSLNSIASAIEKVQSGGLEGIMKQGAGLQVLGGGFAMGSDPFAMMYESFSDPQAYMKRIQGMLKGYGSFNKETGETTFSGLENYMLRTASEQLGVPVEELKDMARGSRQKEYVKAQMGATTLSAENQEAVANKAQYDQDKKMWYVNTINGEKKNVADLTNEDMKNILSNNKEENAEKYAQGTFAAVETIEQTTKTIASKLGAETFDDFVETTQKANQQTLDAFSNNIENISTGISEYRKNSLENQKEMLDKLSTIDKDIVVSFGVVKDYKKYTDDMLKKMQEQLAKMKEESAVAEEKTKNRWGKVENAYKEGKDASYFENFVKGQNMSTARAKWYSARADEKKAKKDYGGYVLDKMNAFGNQTIGRAAQAIGNLFTIDASTVDDYVHDGIINNANNENKSIFTNIEDGIIANSNKPMVTQASNVTKINDGLVKSDPKDVAIFAKEGGVIGNFLDNLYSDVHSSMGGNSMHFDTIKVEMSGSLDLSSGGQSVDIINEIQNNPILLRSLSRMLAQQISASMNGGRGVPNLGIGSI